MRIALRLLSMLLLLGATFGLQGESEAWNARWVGVPIKRRLSPRNQWICFRGRLSLDALPAHTRARIAVDSRYWLWVNGRLAVYEGGLKRGPNPADTYYDELELTPYLRVGDNTFAVLVWYFGKHGFSHKSSGRAGLYFELDAEAGSGATWRALVHPAYGQPEPFEPSPNYRLPESDVRYDARLAPGDWTAVDFDDSAWPPAIELGTPPARPGIACCAGRRRCCATSA